MDTRERVDFGIRRQLALAEVARAVPVETYKFSEISDELIEEVVQFTQAESAAAQAFVAVNGIRHPESMLRLESQMQLVLFGSAQIKKYKDKDGYAFLTRDEITDKINGLGILILDTSLDDPDKVLMHFLGRAFEDRHKGIGASLLEKQNEVLQLRGIKTYKTGVFDSSKAVFQRLGIKIDTIASNPNSKTSQILVSL